MNPREWAGMMVRRAVDAAGVNQSEIARRMGVSHSRVSNMCSGKVNVRIETLFRLMEACGLEVIELQVCIKKHDNIGNH